MNCNRRSQQVAPDSLIALGQDMQTPPLASSPGRDRRWHPRRVVTVTLVVVLVTLGFYLLYLFSNVLFVLFVAMVLATAIRPAVLWLERYRIPQWLGTILVFLVIGGVTIGVLAVLAPLLLSQFLTLAGDIPEYYASFRDWLSSTTIPLMRSFAYRLPAEFPMSLAQPSVQASETVNAVAQAASYLRGLGWSLFGGVAIVLITFFWIVDREQIVRAGLLTVPIDRRSTAREIWDILEEKVGAFVRGQALLCLLIGILSGVAFVLIGLPNALLLAVMAGILEAVPYIGPIATTLLAVSLTLAQSPENIWWVIGACVAIQQIENAILVPRIMDRAVGVNAVVTLLAIAAFGTLLGVGGAIMAIPLAVIVQVLLERLLLNAPQAGAVEITGRDHVSLLRYQAQDLAGDLRDRIKNHDVTADPNILEEDLEAVVGEIDRLLQTITTTNAEAAQIRPA